MLSAADASLVRREPGLPGLAALLDPGAFAETLSTAFPDHEVHKVEAIYLRYKPRTSCLAAFRVTAGSDAISFHARAYRHDSGDKFAKARETAPRSGDRVVVDPLALIIHRFPDDRRLPSLRRLHRSGRRGQILKGLSAEVPGCRHEPLNVIGYKPERRLVASLAEAGAVIKLYRPEDFGRALANARFIDAVDSVRSPARLGHSERHGLLAFGWLEGRPLRSALTSGSFDLVTLSRVGAALANIHRQPGPQLAVRTRTFEAERLTRLARWLGQVQPSLLPRVEDLVRRLAPRLLAAPVALTTIHGDFYDKQILVCNDGGVAVLDFDEAARGDPAHDLGLFIAHLEYQVVRGTLPETSLTACTEALLQGYRAAAGTLPARIELYRCAELLGLAPHPFRTRLGEWSERIQELVDRAEGRLQVALKGSVVGIGNG